MEDLKDMEVPENVKYDSLQVYEGIKFKTTLTRKYKERKPYKAPDPRIIESFIPGTIRKIFIKEGDKVTAGDCLLTLEAMKMLNELRAPIDGIVKHLHVKTGQNVANKQLLIELEGSVPSEKVKEKEKSKGKKK